MNIVCLGGGISTERHVSLVTSTSVCRALRERGHKAIFVDMFLGLPDFEGELSTAFDAPDGFCGNVSIGTSAPDLEAVKASRRGNPRGRLGVNVLELCALADCVFLGLHGADGEDGKIQAALELMGVPYTGSDPLSSGMAMDKGTAKRVMEAFGIRTPRWSEFVYSEEDIPALLDTLPIPCAVKVVNGGSSIGVELPDTREELEKALKNLLSYGNKVIVEEKIYGTEVTVPVLDDRALCPIEIVPPEGMSFDYVAKYQSGAQGAREICPARISEKDTKTVCDAALKFHRSLGLSVYSRTDFIIDENGDAYCLEVNTLPGMTPNSLIPKAAAIDGLSYGELCEKIIELSMKGK